MEPSHRFSSRGPVNRFVWPLDARRPELRSQHLHFRSEHDLFIRLFLNILGTPPSPPPSGVEALKEEPGVKSAGTLRDRPERHRRDPSCASCHRRMDPLGFSLENFDAVGARRAHDGSHPIDPSCKLPSGQAFGGPAELRALLRARSHAFARCFAEKMLTYALGRGPEPTDRRAVEQVVARLEAERYLAGVREIERRIQQARPTVDLGGTNYPRPLGIPADYQEHLRLLGDSSRSRSRATSHESQPSSSPTTAAIAATGPSACPTVTTTSSLLRRQHWRAHGARRMKEPADWNRPNGESRQPVWAD